MGTEAPEVPDATPGVVEWPLAVRPNGTLTFDGIAIGALEFVGGAPLPPPVGEKAGAERAEPRLTLNLGWLRAAGLHVRIEGDPQVDRKRGGLVLER